MSNIYGYVRVSSKSQHEDRQLIAMTELGISSKNIFVDKQSGKDFNRPQYQKMLRKLKENDLVYIKSIDRLGRNYEEILEQWRIITKEIKADIIVLDMPFLDTVDKDTGLTGKLISDLILQILSYVAQTEREFIRQRQKEGIAAAKARGVKFGAKRKPLPENFTEIKSLCDCGELSLRSAAKTLGMPYATFYRKYNDSCQISEIQVL